MKHLAVIALLALALVGTTACPASAAHSVGSAPAATERLQSLEQALLLRANDVRVAHGLRPLVLSADLVRAALFHSRSMLQGGFFAHESKDGSPFSARIKRFYTPSGASSWSAGENLLYDSEMPDAAGAVEAWLNSPPHRHNLLDPTWREVGIAAVHADAAGGLFAGKAATVITMDFGFRKSAQVGVMTSPAKAKAPKPAKTKP